MNEIGSVKSWRPALIIALATITSFLLRLWPPARLGLNHFDEGIYAMAASWVYSRLGIAAIDPSIIPYAPPGYPILIGLSYGVFGLSDQAALLVSALLGSLTVPVVASISGRLFGSRAGVVAACCVCFSGPHIAFSRMVLTDVSFLFVWLVGFAASLRFLDKPCLGTALAMGCLVGLAQQFKYNGWLLGGFVIAASLTMLVQSSRVGALKAWLRYGGWGSLAILSAGIVVFPWFSFVENHGGYDALLKHQQSYLGGWRSWWPHLWIQVNQAVVLAGPTWLSVMGAGAIALSLRLVPSGESMSARTTSIRSLLIAGLLGCMLAAPLTTGLLMVPGLLSKPKISERLVGVSWLGFLILSPFYHPYARLWLPFEALQWIILGGLAVRLMDAPWLTRGSKPARLRTIPMAWPVIFVALGALIVGPGFPFSSPGSYGHAGLFDPSDSLRSVAPTIVGLVPPGASGLRTFVRPALSFYLSGRVAQFPQSDLGSLQTHHDSGQWALVDSALLATPLGRIDQQDRRVSLQPLLDRWELVEEIPSLTSVPTVLDLDPTNPGRSRADSYAFFWLIRPRSSSTAP